MIRTGLAALAALSFAACATQPRPCTAEWVDWKTERIYRDFSRAHQSELQALRDMNAMFAGGGGGNLLSLAMLAPSVVGMVNTFSNDTVPQVRAAVAQCGSPPMAARLFADLLRREGIDPRAADAIERLGLLVETRG